MAAQKKKKKKNLFFGLTARFLMLIAAGILVLSYLTLYVSPARIWLMSIPGLFYPVLLLLNLVLLIWALARLSRSAVIPLLALLPSLFIVNRFVRLSPMPEIPQEGPQVTLVSYNLGRFLQGRGELSGKMQDCRDGALAYLAGTGADVICLQEYYCQNSAELDRMMKQYFPKYHYEYYVNTQTKGLCGNVTISKYPVKGKGRFDFEKSANLALYTDVQLPGGDLRIYNCHFESYNISIPHIVKSLGRDPELRQETEGKIRRSLGLRPLQVDEILVHVRNSPLPTMILGDFNDTPMSYTYQSLTRGHSDSFCDAGRFLGGTYSVLWPLLRIDYILCPDDMTSVRYDVDRVPYSDHYPVKTTLVNK